MNIQRTIIRRHIKIRKIDEQCVVTHKEIVVTKISEFSEKEMTSAKLARKEKKTVPRKNGKRSRKVRAQKLKRFRRNFWKWCSKHKKAIVLILIFSAICLNPGIKEMFIDEELIQFLQLVLSLL